MTDQFKNLGADKWLINNLCHVGISENVFSKDVDCRMIYGHVSLFKTSWFSAQS